MTCKVLVGGSFDIIHVGHIKMLKQAKELCPHGELIVVIARDSTIRKYKKREPILPENDRLEIIKAIKYVDKAILGNELGEKTFFDIIYEIKPDIIALGYDQQINETELKEWLAKKGLQTKIIRLKKYEPESGLNSSSAIRNKILEIYCKRSK